MNILTFVFGLSKGGTERAAIRFAQAYKALGHDSRIVVVRPDGVRTQAVTSSGVPVYELGAVDYQTLIDAWRLDFLHVHSIGILEQDFRRLLADFANPELRVVETNVFSVPSVWESALDESFQMSQWGLWQYLSRGGDQSKARVVPYPAPLSRPALVSKQEARTALGIGPDEIVLGRVGQASGRKWSRAYLRTLRKLAQERPVTFLTVDPPTFLVGSLSRIRTLTVKNFGVVSDDELLFTIYRSMDVMLHIADMGESFGYSIVESEISGVPVVTLATPWADNAQTEVVQHLRTGLVVNRVVNLPAAVEAALKQDWTEESLRLDIDQRYGALRVAKSALEGSQSVTPVGPRARRLLPPRYAAHDRSRAWTLFWSLVPRRVAWVLRGDFRFRELRDFLEQYFLAGKLRSVTSKSRTD